MNFARKRSRYHGTARGRSSEWRYPVLGKGEGDKNRSLASAKRRFGAAMEQIRQYIGAE